jgi:hypothetical protein
MGKAEISLRSLRFFAAKQIRVHPCPSVVEYFSFLLSQFPILILTVTT